jgi:hypothetical protein
MAHEGLNTIDPKVAERWVGEYERQRADNKSQAARGRQELGKIIDLAEGAGLNRKAFTDELKEREWRRKIESLSAGDSEEHAEQKELLKTALGGLPLGDWGVEQMAPTPRHRKKNAAAPGTVQAGMTLAEAKTILSQPRGRGRLSKERKEAERVVAEADIAVHESSGNVFADLGVPGASGAQAEAMAEAMGPDEEDLRPPFLQERDEVA